VAVKTTLGKVELNFVWRPLTSENFGEFFIKVPSGALQEETHSPDAGGNFTSEAIAERLHKRMK
jgi:hypothetical protein